MIPTPERTARESVAFGEPFLVEGAGQQTPGTYTIETVDTLIDELSFLAYRRTSTSIMLPTGASSYQLFPIDPAAVATARKQAMDNDASIGPAERGLEGERSV